MVTRNFWISNSITIKSCENWISIKFRGSTHFLTLYKTIYGGGWPSTFHRGGFYHTFYCAILYAVPLRDFSSFLGHLGHIIESDILHLKNKQPHTTRSNWCNSLTVASGPSLPMTMGKLSLDQLLSIHIFGPNFGIPSLRRRNTFDDFKIL